MPFPLYVVGEVVCGVLLVQGWGLITEALDVRSARRLLPLIGAGAGLAWVLGGLGTSVLAAAIGTPGLLVVATAFLAAAGGVLAVRLGTCRRCAMLRMYRSSTSWPLFAAIFW